MMDPMTDRHSGYLVALHSDIREDDAEHINAIRMIKGVMSVQPVTAAAPEAAIAEVRRDGQWRDGLHGLLREGPGDGG